MAHPRDAIGKPEIYRKWYKLPAWSRRARMHKQLNPLCVECEKRGQVVAAEVSDHIIPHRGDWVLFMHGELQALCSAHHSGEKRQIEINGFTRGIDTSGWPIDERHPARKWK